METKTQKAVNLFKQGDLKKALSIFKTFKTGLNSLEKRSIEIAYECLAGKAGFYSSIGIDVQKEHEKAIEVINKKFLCL